MKPWVSNPGPKYNLRAFKHVVSCPEERLLSVKRKKKILPILNSSILALSFLCILYFLGFFLFKFDAIWLIFTRRNNVIHVGVSELMNGPGPGAAVVKKKRKESSTEGRSDLCRDVYETD